MIIVGIDDTDTVDSRGTNQLARQISREVSPQWKCLRIVRHQLLDDPRVPYTSKNGSASMTFQWRANAQHAEPDEPQIEQLWDCCRRIMLDEFIVGSDPGLSLLAGPCPPVVIQWGQKCQSDFVEKSEAREIAIRTGFRLESLGGTGDGIIGALAAIGLSALQNDGRIIQLGDWSDDLSGLQSVSLLSERGVSVREFQTGREVDCGTIDLGKKLRPNMRHGRAVLFVEPVLAEEFSHFRALKLP
ncbi:MAG TPA: hypothetical protein VLA12_01905 [Planctomycetaceae bacterium]|nr:hypothetical protein [Planctomycetaceae bacterium]